MHIDTEFSVGKRSNAQRTETLHILRFSDVVKRTGLSKSTIYGQIRSREFPTPVSLGPRAVGFVAHEVDDWLERLIIRSRNHLTEAR